MAWVTGKIAIDAEGAILVGGHSPAPAFLDAGHARDADGRCAVLPGSAVRGVLREAMTRWLHAHDRGDEVTEPWQPPDRHGDGALIRLFGRPGADRPGLDEEARPEHRGGLRIDDAVTVGRPPTFGVRTGVAVDRRTGHAAEGHLYQREVAEARGVRFEAPFEGDADPADLEALADAAEIFADRIGNSRSRGLGAIRVTVTWAAGGGQRPVRVAKLGEQVSTVRVTLTAGTDLHLGDIPDRTSVRETLGFVPGSALRGALVWAAVDAGKRADPGFDALANRASFSDLWPSDPVASPEPRTVFGCVAHERERVDTIVSASLLPRLLAHGGAPATLVCPTCGAPLRPSARTPAAITRMVTRLALDPRTGSAAPGMLHGRQQIAKGTTFIGSAALGAPARALLEALDRPVRVGGLRARGLGVVTVAIERFDSGAVESELKQFERAASALVPDSLAADLGLPGAGWLQLVARTPLRLPPSAAPAGAAAILAGILPQGTFAVASHQRTGVRSGWRDGSWQNGVARTEPLRATIEAGSTWLFRLPCSAADPRVVEAVVRAATAGVGELTELGLGRLGPPSPMPLTLSTSTRDA